MKTYLSPDQVCELIPGMTTGLLAQMRYRGDGPRYMKPSPRKVVYDPDEIERFMVSREVSSTAEKVSA